MRVLRTPEARFENLPGYPFRPNYLEVEPGLRMHFGFFPVPLALCGLALLWRRTTNDEAARLGARDLGLGTAHESQVPSPKPQGPSPTLVLVVGTFAVALLFGSLPFITRAALSTRWLMFSAWAIAVAGALGLAQLWRRGLGARVISIAMALYVGWLTIALWVAALALRQPPIEPF